MTKADMLDKPKAWIVEHPSRRAWVTAALTILTSLIIGALMRTLVQGTSIAWCDIWQSPYFYALIIVYCMFATLQSSALRFDKKIAKSIAKNNPYKYVQYECLDDYAAHCKKLLADGKLEEYHKAQDQLPGKGITR